MKCPGCGYQNKPEAFACNLCGKVLRRERREGAPAGGLPTEVLPAARLGLDMPATPVPAPATPVPAPATPAPASPSRATPAASQPRPKAPRAVAAPGDRRHLLVRPGAPSIVLETGEPFTIGRQNSCTLPIPSTRVSRLHAEIRWDGDRPQLVDKGSSNGTFVKGKRVKEHTLVHGDEIEIGPFLCVYRFDDPRIADADLSPSDASEGTQTLAAAGDSFTGMVNEQGVAEVLQGLEFNAKTGTLDVFGKEGEGSLCVQTGLPLNAVSGALRDDEAVLKILSFRQGRYTFAPKIEDPQHRMRTTLTALLLEWGRRSDEASERAAKSTAREALADLATRPDPSVPRPDADTGRPLPRPRTGRIQADLPTEDGDTIPDPGTKRP